MLAALTLASAVAGAAGPKGVSLPPCLPRPREIAVYGRLGEWSGVEDVSFSPIVAFGQGEVGAARRDLGASVGTCYDAEALYLAVEWLSPLPPSNSTDPSDANPDCGLLASRPLGEARANDLAQPDRVKGLAFPDRLSVEEVAAALRRYDEAKTADLPGTRNQGRSGRSVFVQAVVSYEERQPQLLAVV